MIVSNLTLSRYVLSQLQQPVQFYRTASTFGITMNTMVFHVQNGLSRPQQCRINEARAKWICDSQCVHTVPTTLVHQQPLTVASVPTLSPVKKNLDRLLSTYLNMDTLSPAKTSSSSSKANSPQKHGQPSPTITTTTTAPTPTLPKLHHYAQDPQLASANPNPTGPRLQIPHGATNYGDTAAGTCQQWLSVVHTDPNREYIIGLRMALMLCQCTAATVYTRSYKGNHPNHEEVSPNSVNTPDDSIGDATSREDSFASLVLEPNADFLVPDDFYGAWSGAGTGSNPPAQGLGRHACDRNINPSTGQCRLADHVDTQNSGDICLSLQVLENSRFVPRSDYVPKLYQFMLSCQVRSVAEPKVCLLHATLHTTIHYHSILPS